MHFEIDRKELAKAISAVASVVEKKGTLTILRQLLISVGDGEVEVQASDLQTTITARVSADVRSPGKISVPADQLGNVVSKLSGDTVTFRLKKNGLEVFSGNTVLRLNVTPSEDFPELPRSPSGDWFEIPPGLLKNLFAKTVNSAYKDEINPQLNVVFLEPEEQVVHAVATNTHILSVMKVSLEGDAVLQNSIMVPKKGAEILAKLLKRAVKEKELPKCEMAVEGKYVWVRLGRITVSVRLYEGKPFLLWQRVVPSECDISVEISCEDVKKAADRVALVFSKEDHGTIKITITGDGGGSLSISAHNATSGDSEATLDVEYSGPERTCYMGAHNFTEALSQVEEKVAYLEFQEADLNPIVVRGEDYLGLIMPVRP